MTEKDDWVVSFTRKGGANIILWGMPRSLSMLEIRAKLADIGLARVARGSMRWEGDHVRIAVKPEDSRGTIIIIIIIKLYNTDETRN